MSLSKYLIICLNNLWFFVESWSCKSLFYNPDDGWHRMNWESYYTLISMKSCWNKNLAAAFFWEITINIFSHISLQPIVKNPFSTIHLNHMNFSFCLILKILEMLGCQNAIDDFFYIIIYHIYFPSSTQFVLWLITNRITV